MGEESFNRGTHLCVGFLSTLIDLYVTTYSGCCCDKTRLVIFTRDFVEAVYSQRDNSAGNEHIDIPDVYNSLALSRAAVVFFFAAIARAEL